MESSSLHPIRLMARDSEIQTALHSFFLFTLEDQIICSSRHPANVDIFEEGLIGLLQTIDSPQEVEEYVLSNHFGRFFVFLYTCQSRCIALVSCHRLPFCRELLQQLDQQEDSLLLPVLYSLCDLPLLAMPRTRYTFLLGNALEVRFQPQLDESALLYLLLTPLMLCRAWEALLMETRILILSSVPALLLPAAELLRSMCLPCPYTGTYIPRLPYSWAEATQAPGTFIIGLAVCAGQPLPDSTGMLVLDLDTQTCTPSHVHAPSCLLDAVTQSIRQITCGPIGSYCSRGMHPMRGANSPNTTTNSMNMSAISNHEQVTENLLAFVQSLNLQLLSAQLCSINAFYRFRDQSPTASMAAACLRGLDHLRTVVSSSPISFTRVFNISAGCLHLSRTSYGVLPVWVEMDPHGLAIYEYADDLPLCVTPLADITAVLGSALEPDGYVFDIHLLGGAVHRFTATDKASRQLWIASIEAAMAAAAEGQGAVAAVVSGDLSEPEALLGLFAFRHTLRSGQGVMQLYAAMEVSGGEAEGMRMVPGPQEKRLLAALGRISRPAELIQQMLPALLEEDSTEEVVEEDMPSPLVVKVRTESTTSEETTPPAPLRRGLLSRLSGRMMAPVLPPALPPAAPLPPAAAAPSPEEEELLAQLANVHAAHLRCLGDIAQAVLKERTTAVHAYLQKPKEMVYDLQDMASKVRDAWLAEGGTIADGFGGEDLWSRLLAADNSCCPMDDEGTSDEDSPDDWLDSACADTCIARRASVSSSTSSTMSAALTRLSRQEAVNQLQGMSRSSLTEGLLAYALQAMSGAQQGVLSALAKHGLADHRHVSACLLHAAKGNGIDLLHLACHGKAACPSFGLQALRLFLEGWHADLTARLHVLGGQHKQTQMQRSHRMMLSCSPAQGTSFGYVPATVHDTTVLNESFTCVRSDTSLSACALSIDLLRRLREVLRSYAQSSASKGYLSRAPHDVCLCTMRIPPELLKDLEALSAFKRFQVDACQLQKVDLDGMSQQERLLFFTNVHNTLMIHGTVSMCPRNSKPSDLLAFLQAAKYNISGHIFSLADIQQGVLLSSSTSNLMSAFSGRSFAFQNHDPRHGFRLSIPCPHLCFSLFQGLSQSPELVILEDVDTVAADVAMNARQYLAEHITLDIAQRTVLLPALCRVFWADLKGKKEDLLKEIMRIAGADLGDKMREFVQQVGKRRIKVQFAASDWTTVFIFAESM